MKEAFFIKGHTQGISRIIKALPRLCEYVSIVYFYTRNLLRILYLSSEQSLPMPMPT